MCRATRLADAIYLPSSVAISPAVEPTLTILISICTSPLVHCLGLWFHAPSSGSLESFHSWNEMPTAWISAHRICICNETKLGQNFLHRGWLHISLGYFNPAALTTRGRSDLTSRWGLRRMAARVTGGGSSEDGRSKRLLSLASRACRRPRTPALRDLVPFLFRPHSKTHLRWRAAGIFPIFAGCEARPAEPVQRLRPKPVQ